MVALPRKAKTERTFADYWQRPPMYDKQAAFVDSDARYTIVEASTKTGKTVACLIWLLEQGVKCSRPGRNYWWIAPTYTVAGIAFTRLKTWLAGSSLPKSAWRALEGDQAIELGSGAKLWFKGADKPDNLYGEDVYAAVVDEATRCKPDAWAALRSTLTATQGPVKIIGNVRGRKNWAYGLARKAKAGAAGMAYFKLTAYDAVAGGVLELAEVEDAKALLPEHVFKELYLAEPSDDGGNPFGLAAIERAKREGLSSKPTLAYGVDLAKSVDHTVICGMDIDGGVSELERWQSDWGMTRRRLAAMIGDRPALVDSTGVGDPVVEDLQAVCPGVEGYKFSSQSKQQLMEGLASDFQQNAVAIPAGWLADECESFEFEYKPGGRVTYSAPDGLHDDGVCALALARRKVRTILGGFMDLVCDDVQVVS